jgi:hypothetical protein
MRPCFLYGGFISDPLAQTAAAYYRRKRPPEGILPQVTRAIWSGERPVRAGAFRQITIALRIEGTVNQNDIPDAALFVLC